MSTGPTRQPEKRSEPMIFTTGAYISYCTVQYKGNYMDAGNQSSSMVSV